MEFESLTAVTGCWGGSREELDARARSQRRQGVQVAADMTDAGHHAGRRERRGIAPIKRRGAKEKTERTADVPVGQVARLHLAFGPLDPHFQPMLK